MSLSLRALFPLFALSCITEGAVVQAAADVVEPDLEALRAEVAELRQALDQARVSVADVEDAVAAHDARLAEVEQASRDAAAWRDAVASPRLDDHEARIAALEDWRTADADPALDTLATLAGELDRLSALADEEGTVVTSTSTQTIANVADCVTCGTKVTAFNVVRNDPDRAWDTTAHRYVAAADGWYFASAVAPFDRFTIIQALNWSVQIRPSNMTTNAWAIARDGTTVNSYEESAPSASGLFFLRAGEHLEVFASCRTNTGASCTLHKPSFTAIRLR